MRRIYFEKRCITICNTGDPILDPQAPLASQDSDIHDFVTKFKSTPTIESAYLVSENSQGAYSALCHEFKEVNAAGGLVSDGQGNYLMIRRFGKWDLPKGHQEAGEEISETAVREVSEETGVRSLELGKLRCVTDHCYLRDGIWHLKHSWWYDMLCTVPVKLLPQEEEGISSAVWVPESEIESCLQEAYPSIAEVFHCKKV